MTRAARSRAGRGALALAALPWLACASGDAAPMEGVSSPSSSPPPSRSPWEAARRRGVDFRAVGNEPGWHLEIADEEWIRLVTDYGAHAVRAPVPDPVVDPEAGTLTYDVRAGGHHLRAVIEATPCRDDMSGEAFPSRVRVELDGRRLEGCGRPLGAGPEAAGPETSP